MKKTLIALLVSAGIAVAGGGSVDFGDGITGTWNEYNMKDSITTGADFVTLPSSWGGPTAWINLQSTLELSQDQVLTFSYTYSSTTTNGIYSITFKGDGGKSAFMIGNTEYGNRDLAAASCTLGTTGFHQNEAQSIRYNPGNSSDRFQTVASTDQQITLGAVTPGVVTATIMYNSGKGVYELCLKTGDKMKVLDLGTSVKFDTISFAADGNQSQSFNDLSLKVSTIPEPTTATLSLLALAGLAARRRRK